ncbi:barstar family protein [Streptomyces sp. NPDC002143]
MKLTTGEAPVEAISAVVLGAECRSSAGLFSEWARALEFPAHFGHNWDAFYDCVSEKALWRFDPDGPPPVHPLTIVVEDAAHMLVDAPQHDLEVLLRALSDAATIQDGDEDAGHYPYGIRLHLLLRDTPAGLLDLAQRMRVAGFLPPDAPLRTA